MIFIVVMKVITVVAAGALWLLASGITRKTDGAEKVVLAVSLGLVSVMLVGLLSVVAGLPLGMVGDYVLILLAAGSSIVWLAGRPKLVRPRLRLDVSRRYWLPVALFFSHFALWVIYLVNYPHFPNSGPIDVIWHCDITRMVLRGTVAGPLAEAGFPAGSHIFFALLSAYLGVDVLSSMRIASAVIESLSVPVAYCLFQRFLPNRQSATYAAIAFSLMIPAGLTYYARIGAYPNIVGDFLVLVSLLLAIIVSEKLTLPSVLTAAVIQAVALTSHVSVTILVVLVFWFAAIVFRQFHSHFHTYIVSNVGFFVFPLATLAAAPNLSARAFEYISKHYFDLNNNLGLVLEQWLYNFPVLVGSFNFVLVLAAFAWVVVRSEKRIWSLFLASWFGLLFLLVLVSTQSWRLILLSLVPGAGLLGIFLSEFQQILEKMSVRGNTAAHLRRLYVSLVMLTIIVVSTIVGPTVFAVNETLASGQASRQNHIYGSMVWLQANSSPDSAVVSVSLQKEYRYLPVVANRSYQGDYQLNSDSLLRLRGTVLQFDYVTVAADFSGLETYYAFQEVYRNPIVIIFQLSSDQYVKAR